MTNSTSKPAGGTGHVWWYAKTGAWAREQDLTRFVWTFLLWLSGINAVFIGYLAIWASWVGVETGWDTTTGELLGPALLTTSHGLAVSSILVFLTTVFLAGYRTRKPPRGPALVVAAAYSGYISWIFWKRFDLPRGHIYSAAWDPVVLVLASPEVWPAALLSALLVGRMRRRPRARSWL